MMIELHDVHHAWPGRQVLANVGLAIEAGDAVSIMGPSGSGKSTLLNLIAGIMVPESGSVEIDGTEITAMSVSERAAFRLHNIGMVFQFGELLPELSVIENVSLPLRLQGTGTTEAMGRAQAMLQRLDVSAHAEKFPNDLSGGEAQRVGIARALAHKPKVVLADEPTGALDEENGRLIANLLVGVAREWGTTVIVATHDPDIAAFADHHLQLHGGTLVRVKEPTLVETGAA